MLNTLKELAKRKGFETTETSRKLTLDNNVSLWKIDKYKIHVIGDMILINQNDFLQILQESKKFANENS